MSASNRLHEVEVQVPEKMYSCAGGCNLVYSADMIGHDQGKDDWYCTFCQEDVFWGMSEEESAKLFDDDAPLPPALPRPWYSCASDFCAEDQSFRDEDLFLSDKDGRFWCSGCYPDRSGESEHSLSLQQYLAQEASHGIKRAA